MTDLVVKYDSNNVIIDFQYPARDDYEFANNEVALDAASYDHRDLLPLGSKRVNTESEPPTIEANPDYKPPNPLDRSDIDPSLKDDYQAGVTAWQTAKSDWQAAKTDADAAASAYDDASTAGEKADALDARADALQAQEQAVADLFTNGIIPAMDALFTVAYGEEPPE